MDAIRKAQINEVLDYDKNINSMVFNLSKSQVADYQIMCYHMFN
jgi:hypothetical protein